jgi:thioredoxin 1
MSNYKTFGQLSNTDAHPQKPLPARGHAGTISTAPAITAPPSNPGGGDNEDIHHFSSQEEKDRATSSHRLVVVDVYADWCGPCRTISPLVKELAAKYNKPGLCFIGKEDADLGLTRSVTALPSFLFYVDGVVVETIVGADVKAVEKKICGLLADLM